jgi:hypothetical protein
VPHVVVLEIGILDVSSHIFLCSHEFGYAGVCGIKLVHRSTLSCAFRANFETKPHFCVCDLKRIAMHSIGSIHEISSRMLLYMY